MPLRIPVRRLPIIAIAVGFTVLLATPAAATPPGSNGLGTWQRETQNGPPHLWVAAAYGAGARRIFARRNHAALEGSFSPPAPNVFVFTRGGSVPFSEDIYAGDLVTGAVRRIIGARSGDIA